MTSQKTSLNNIIHLSDIILENYPTVSQTTVIDHQRQLCQIILENHLKQSYTTINNIQASLGNFRDNYKTAPQSVNRSTCFDPKATQSCLKCYDSKVTKPCVIISHLLMMYSVTVTPTQLSIQGWNGQSWHRLQGFMVHIN